MKKLIYSTLAIAAIFSTFSCRKEAMGDYQVADGVSVRGAFDADFQKTSINEKGKVEWEAGDRVTFVWNKNFYYGSDEDIKKGWVITTNKNTLSSPTANFEVKLPYLDTYSGGYAEVFGVYPGIAGYTCTIDKNNDFRVLIPTNYDFTSVTDGGFALSSITAGKVVFESDKKASAEFKNICALLKVTLPANTAKFTVRVDPTNSDPLAGYIKIDKDNLPNIIAGGTTGKKYADTVLVSTTGLAAAATYYVPVLPGEMKLLAVTAFDKDGVVLGDTQSVSPALGRAQVYTIEMAESYSAHKRFMCLGGSGDRSGVNWENAWGLAEFSANINREICDSVIVYIKQGTYNVTSSVYNDNVKGGICVTNKKSITLIGSFPSGNTGVEYGKNDPSKGPNIDGNSGGQATIFDGGGTANSGGGAKLFDFRGCNVTMKHIEFAHADVFGNQRGTALYYSCNSGSENIKATLEKCYFVENYNSSAAYANGTGGAVYFNDETQTGQVEMECTGCKFDSNASGHSGGAVFMYVSSSKTASATFTDCEFTGNASNGNRGGAIHQEGGTLTVTNSRFYSNTAVSYGGAISVSKSSGSANTVLDIYNNDFGKDGDSSQKNSVTGEGTDQGGGGAIHARVEDGDGNSGTVTVTSKKRNRFYGNTSTKSGGAISLYNNASFTSHGDIFKGNSSSLANGGAIGAYYGCTLTFTADEKAAVPPYGTQFVSNSAKVLGGAVWIDASNVKATPLYAVSTLSSTSSIFTGNSCATGGGAVCFSGSVGKEGTASFAGDSFSENYARGNSSDGGAVYATATALTISNNCIFDGNFVDNSEGESELQNNSDGGAVFIWKCLKSSIGNSSFKSNRATRDGGAVYVNACEGLTVSYCTFGENGKPNSATGNGGAVRIIGMTSNDITDENMAKFTNNTFAYNTAGDCGGAIAVINSSTSTGKNIGLQFVSPNTFSYNKAANFGGAVEIRRDQEGFIETYGYNHFCSFAGCTFDHNEVTTTVQDRNKGGAAIHAKGMSGKPLRLNLAAYCKFITNKCEYTSAAVLLETHAHMQMSRAYFYDNVAAYTADVRIVEPVSEDTQDAYAYFTNCVFENSKSTANDACGISVSLGKVDGDKVTGTLAMNNCSFYGQSHNGTPAANGDRSVIFCRYNPALIINCTIFGNTLATSGTLASMTYLSGRSDHNVVLCNNIISGGIFDNSNRVYSIQGPDGTTSTVFTGKGHNWIFQPDNNYGADLEPAGHMNRNNSIMATNTFSKAVASGGRGGSWNGSNTVVENGYYSFTNDVAIANYANKDQILAAIDYYASQNSTYDSEKAKDFFNSVTFAETSNPPTSLDVDIRGTARFTTLGNHYTLPGSWHNTVPNQKTIVPTINPITDGGTFDWGGAQ